LPFDLQRLDDAQGVQLALDKFLLHDHWQFAAVRFHTLDKLGLTRTQQRKQRTDRSQQLRSYEALLWLVCGCCRCLWHYTLEDFLNKAFAAAKEELQHL